MTEHGAWWVFVWMTMVALGLALVLSGCAPAGTARECAFARPLILSHRSIAGLDPEDARAVLRFNEQAAAVCG